MNHADTLALCWRIERRDGGGLALTSHDRPLTHEAITYEPAPGLLPATITRRAGLLPGNADIDGAISAAALTERDFELGRWDGAAIRLDAVRWDDNSVAAVCLMAGEIGEVAVSGNAFSAELRGPAAVLDAPACPSTSSECRAALGDRQCRVDMAGRRKLVSVTAASSDGVTVSPMPDNRYAGGRLILLDGAACGWSSPIVAVDGGDIILREAPRIPIAVGTRAWIEEGCDKRFETCRSRFSNPLNFRGEPYLPVNDLLTRYPGG